MIRYLLLSVLLMCLAAPSAMAQTGLNIESAFTADYTRDPKCRVSTLSGERLKKFNLRLYRSLSLTGMPQAASSIEPKVRRDGSKATDKEVSYSGGRLTYGFYTLPPSGGLNRYIIYLNTGSGTANKIVLLYMEGKASADDVRRMIK